MATPDVIYKETIGAFYGGMPDSEVIQSEEISVAQQHIDIFSDPKGVTPYLAMEPDETLALGIILFIYAANVFYGLGIASGDIAEVYFKASDVITGAWNPLTNGAASSGARVHNCFIGFEGYAYGGAGTGGSSRIWAADLSGANAFTDPAYSSAGLPIAQGLVTTDDLLLIPCSAGLAVKDGAGTGPTNAWSTFNIVPVTHTMTDLCELGDVVAIAAKPRNFGVNSKVFLWNKVAQDNQQVIDFGDGDLQLLFEQEGSLIGIVQVNANTGFSQKARLVIRQWSGGSKANQIKEIICDDNSLVVYGNHIKVVDGNRVVFGMKIKLDGVTYNQLFSFGRKTPAYPLALSGDRLVDNDTPVATIIEGLFKTGDYYWVSHNQDGSINRTNDNNSYAGVTPTYITNRINGEKRVQDAARRRKVLKMAGLIVAPLTSGQSASLYYRTDSNSSWILIRKYVFGTDTTNSLVPANCGFEAGMADLDAVTPTPADFTNYKEVQFMATLAGGAKLKNFVWAWQFAGADVLSE